MSRVHILLLLGLSVGGIALVAAQQAGSGVDEFTELHRGEIADSELEIVMGVLQRSGESNSGKHFHPGGEFGFVLAGAVTVTSQNQPPVTLIAGSSFHQPPGEWHDVSTSAQGAKTVIFRVLKKGEPMVVQND